jgi:thiol-disulfide isomerase/thioredoxin
MHDLHPRIRRATLAVSLLFAAAPVLAQQDQSAPPAPPAPPSARPPQQQPAARAASQSGRPAQQILADINQAGAELNQALGEDQTLLVDPVRREQAAPKVRAALNRLGPLADELAAAGDGAAAGLARDMKNKLLRLRAVFGDQQMTSDLQAQANSGGEGEALSAKVALLFARWVKASHDPAEQGKVLDDARALADTHPEQNEVTEMLLTMSDLGPASPELASRAGEIAGTMKSAAAQQAKDRIVADKKLHGLENKPIALHGKTIDGKDFSSDQWKGKVILVDFWATWCGPCKAMLPKLNQMYAQYHDKGFEIVGVSCDKDPNALKKYLAQSKDIHWPQLYGGNNPDTGWHPLAEEFGIINLPMQLLIDKKGTLRAFGAGEAFESQIPKLLEEQG